MADNSNKANLIAKILFIAGGIILFIVLVIFIFRMVPVVISNISNLGSGIAGIFTNEKIAVTTDVEITETSVPVIVSFQYEPKKEGEYYVDYKCIDGFFFDIQSQDGPKRLICETPLKLGSDLNSISLIPLLTDSNAFADSEISILYKDARGNTVAKGSTIITVKDGASLSKTATSTNESNPYNANGKLSGSTVTAKPITTSTTKTTSTTQTSRVYSNPSRDLQVSYIGAIDSSSAFVMHVYNYGNTTTGPWEFAYTDAENPSKTVLSPIQGSLGAGQGLAITVRFDGQANSNQKINITLDPLNKISEANESNNSTSVTINGSRSGSGNSGSYDPKDDADLVITSMQVGRISGNRFVEDDEIEDNDTAAVRFIVKNQGGESTGSWRFEVNNLPYDNDDSYRSRTQPSLKPGQSLEIIVDFDGIDDGQYRIEIEVDSDDDVDEESERNNTESETLEVNR